VSIAEGARHGSCEISESRMYACPSVVGNFSVEAPCHDPCEALGVAHDEEPLANLARADLSRREESRRNAVTHTFQSLDDVVESKAKMPWYVLEEDEPGFRLLSDSSDMGENVSRIVLAASSSGL
jgi:hypothetical protein